MIESIKRLNLLEKKNGLNCPYFRKWKNLRGNAHQCLKNAFNWTKQLFVCWVKTQQFLNAIGKEGCVKKFPDQLNNCLWLSVCVFMLLFWVLTLIQVLEIKWPNTNGRRDNFHLENVMLQYHFWKGCYKTSSSIPLWCDPIYDLLGTGTVPIDWQKLKKDKTEWQRIIKIDFCQSIHNKHCTTAGIGSSL